jgi:hypothetical protein
MGRPPCRDPRERVKEEINKRRGSCLGILIAWIVRW